MPTTTAEASPMGNYRWVIVTLLFFATTINYLDRQVIGLLKDNLAQDFKWTEKDYSYIVMAFSAAYAIGLLLFGIVVDRIGTKLGYVVSIIIWSIAAMAHALARSTVGFGIARTFLGFGEAGNFPVAIKAIAEWFPKKERALATGLFNSGTNIAAFFGPPLIAWIFTSYGWKEAFIWTGAIGFIWLIFWYWLYEIPTKQKRLGNAEFQYIHSDKEEEVKDISRHISWFKLIGVRQTWAFVFGKLLTDPVWWFYLFWMPTFFNSTYHMEIKESAKYVSIVYVLASVGSILGGYLSGRFINAGWPVYRARKTAMLIFAFCVTPIFFVQYATNIWSAVALVSLAASAHQAWSANIFTTASDMFPKRAVSSVVGIGGMAGSVGGFFFPFFIGTILDHYKSLGNIHIGYNIIFTICAFAYLVAWLIMHLMAPRMEQVSV